MIQLKHRDTQWQLRTTDRVLDSHKMINRKNKFDVEKRMLFIQTLFCYKISLVTNGDLNEAKNFLLFKNCTKFELLRFKLIQLKYDTS